ncbi:MAG: peptidoglycan DD-metalloendopeptidase family protein [Anaerovoracaceae bacterium]
MKKNTIISIFLCFVMLLSTTVVYATSLDNINDKLDNKKEELESGKKHEQQLNNSISAVNKRIAIAEGNIEELQKEVTRIHKRIAKVSDSLVVQKKKLAKGQEGLDKRLRNMYKSGSMGFVDVLLSSTNVSELISNLEMVQAIYTNDKEIVGSLKNRYKQIEDKRDKLKDLEKQLKEKQVVLDAKQTSLSKDKELLASKRDDVKISNAQLEKQIDELNAEADRIKDEIQNNSGNENYEGGVMQWPVPGNYYVSSPFGYRIHPIFGTKKFHTGIDIPAPTGSRIVAANGGRVISAYYNSSYGNVVIIDHGGGIATLYAHNSSLLVHSGQTVTRGQTIARAGSTGNSTGPHSHFEVRINGNYVDPRKYV